MVRASVDVIGLWERVGIRTEEEVPTIPDFVAHAEDARPPAKAEYLRLASVRSPDRFIRFMTVSTAEPTTEYFSKSPDQLAFMPL